METDKPLNEYSFPERLDIFLHDYMRVYYKGNFDQIWIERNHINESKGAYIINILNSNYRTEESPDGEIYPVSLIVASFPCSEEQFTDIKTILQIDETERKIFHVEIIISSTDEKDIQAMEYLYSYIHSNFTGYFDPLEFYQSNSGD